MITVFTTNQCAYCVMVKKFLTSRGKEYEVVNLEENPGVRQSLLQRTGAMTVPIIQIGEQYVVGWNLPRLSSLINNAS